MDNEENKGIKETAKNYLDKLLEKMDYKSIFGDTNPVFENIGTSLIIDDEEIKPRLDIIEPQVTYRWLVVEMNNEIEINIGDVIDIQYDGDKLSGIFFSFGSRFTSESDDINNPSGIPTLKKELDATKLCLYIDERHILGMNKLPQFTKLFPYSPDYDQQVFNRNRLTFHLNGQQIEYERIAF